MSSALQWPDYVVLAAFLLISLGIGFYHSVTGGRQKTTQEFIMANRKLSILPTAISMFVSLQSAIMILGSTAEMYEYGVQFLVWTPVSYFLSILITERLIVPWIFPLKLVSINDYFEQRYESKAVRILGSIIAIIGEVLYMGVAMYAPSAALDTATGLPTTISIPLMAVVSIAYTALGGMRAVIWTDVFQCLTILGGMLAILIKGVIEVGGFQRVWDICGSEERLQTCNWSLDPTERHTVWGFLIGYTISWIQAYGLTQASVQRYSATKSLTEARVTLLLNIPANALLTFLACFTGLTVFAYYSDIRCDPLVNKDVSNSNQLLALFVTTLFSKTRGFTGLFLATLYGGALSSVSSSLSGAAANCWDDILKFKLSGMSEQRQALLNRFLVIIFGALSMLVAFLASIIPGPISQISMSFGSAVYGPILGVFLMGGISRHANWRGALFGGICALGISTWLVVGSYRVHLPSLPSILPPTSVDGCWYNSNETATLTASIVPTTTSGIWYNATLTDTDDGPSLADGKLTGLDRFYTLSYIWYTLFGAVIATIIGMITSFVFRDREAEARIDDKLLIPFRQCLSWSESKPTTTSADDQSQKKKEEEEEITDVKEDVDIDDKISNTMTQIQFVTSF